MTFSIRGYRDSELTAHPHTVQTEQTIEDTQAVIEWVIAQGFAKPHLLGWPWGGRICRRYAETRSDRIDRLELDFMEADAHEQLVVQAERDEPKAPNSIRVENENGSVAVDAATLNNRTLMLYGYAAGMQNYMQGGSVRGEVLEKMPTLDKGLVMVADGGDYAHLQNARHRIWKTMADFLYG